MVRVVCEMCGLWGPHPECDLKRVRGEVEAHARDEALARRYARHGVLGIATPASRASHDEAVVHLERYRP